MGHNAVHNQRGFATSGAAGALLVTLLGRICLLARESADKLGGTRQEPVTQRVIAVHLRATTNPALHDAASRLHRHDASNLERPCV
ncbi:MAG TPA: hypothetical protein VNQ55_05895 [Parapedobacter sp.]|nr:hypothetical protein [Parapedobacter sp.]